MSRCSFPHVAVLSLVVLISSAGTVPAQVPPDEHAKHHPQQGQETSSRPTEQGKPAGGMMGGMGDMMKAMGVPPKKDLYPALMDVPDLPAEERGELTARAHERMKSGTARLSSGLDKLVEAAPGSDFGAMQDAVAEMREGLAEFESGLAAHRALVEGRSPRNIALQWFKRELDLLEAPGAAARSGPLGISWFHFFVMVVLVGFSTTMIWMYFHKMRRAADLLERLTSGSPATPNPGPPSSEAVSPPAPVPSPRQQNGKWSGDLRVARTFTETPDVTTFRLVDPSGKPRPFDFLPGQFLTLSVEPEGKPVRRSYTIASSPTRRDYAEITVKREDQGLVSRHLHERVREGDVLQISAPSGKFTFDGTDTDSIVLIAGGVGVTPMMSIARYLTDRGWPGEIFFLFCCRTQRDVIFRDEISYLSSRYPNFKAALTLSREEGNKWKGPRGRLTKEFIAAHVPGIASRRVHVCGPKAMMEAVKATLLELGVPNQQVKTESFGGAKQAVAQRVAADADGASLTTATVTFASSGKSAPLPPDETVLDVADELGVEIDSSCREGTCGTCMVKLVSGDVTMKCEDGLSDEDRGQGYVLACQAKAKADVVVEA